MPVGHLPPFMRIALLSHSYPPDPGIGDVGLYTWHHARALARLGHDVHVIAGSREPVRQTTMDGPVTVTRLGKRGLLVRLLATADGPRLQRFLQRLQHADLAFAALRHELRRQSFDVIEVADLGGEGALLAHCLDLPIVVRLHGALEWTGRDADAHRGDRALAALVERLGIRGGRALTACSRWLLDAVRQRLKLQSATAVIPHGIDVEALAATGAIDLRAQFGLPDSALVLGVDTGLQPRRSARLLSQLLPPLLDRHADVVCVVVGDDPDQVLRAELLPQLQQRGTADRCRHADLTAAERRAVARSADVVLRLDDYESAPYALLEAMASGRAVVAAAAGGTPEILRHAVERMLADAASVPALRRALDRVLGSEAHRRRFGIAAKGRIAERFDAAATAAQAAQFYARVTGAGAAAPRVGDAEPQRLGPDNWFEAGWLRGASTAALPQLDPAFADASLDELSFAQSLLSNLYWRGGGTGGSAEAAFLDALGALYRRQTAAARQSGRAAAGNAGFALPPIDHPLFLHAGSAQWFVDELWRLGDSPVLLDWLHQQASVESFAALAVRDMPRRRLAIEAAMRRPCAATFALLQAIYRDGEHRDAVVQQDLEFIASGGKGAQLEHAVQRLGLHAPLRRPPVFGKSRRGAPAPSDAAVTVLIPSYRHEAYVGAAIKSALGQSHAPTKVLVVDDQSPDGTVAAARKVRDDRLEIRQNERNLGLGGSIAAALPSITTPYVALMNSDDLFHGERLQRCLAVLEQRPEVKLVATGIALMDRDARRLQPATACAIDLGLPAFDWVHWYDRIGRELGDDGFAAFAPLLRHNHLITSSNIVCRTDYLRRREADFARLKYCLDWSLFLHAAADDALAYLPEPLLAYRLHASNTVWFSEQDRPGYVHEVNAVIAAVLHTLAERRWREGRTPQSLVEEIARLLHEDVAAHGESDGLTMFLAELTRDLPCEPATVGAAEVAALAQRALAAHRQPSWRREPQAEIDRHAADAFMYREIELEATVARMAADLREAWSRAGDGNALRQRIDEGVQQVTDRQQDLAAARGELQQERGQRHQLEQQLGTTAAQLQDSERRTAETEHQLQATAAQRDQLAEQQQRTAAELAQTAADRDRTAAELAQTAADRDRTAAELAQTAAERDGAARELLRAAIEHDRVLGELQQTDALLSDTRSELAAHRQLGAQLRAELGSTQSELKGERQRLASTSADLRQTQQWLRDEVDQRLRRSVAQQLQFRARLQQLEQSHEWRLGRLLLKKLHLHGAFKTALRAWTHVRTGGLRGSARLRRALPLGTPERILLVGDGACPSPFDGHLAAQQRALCAAGLDARVLGWATASRRLLTPELQPALRGRVVVPLDAALQARDRRWCEQHRAASSASVALTLLAPGEFDRCCSLSRTASALGATYLQGSGFGPGTRMAWGAARLLRVRFGLRLVAADLLLLDSTFAQDLVRDAALVAVDCDATAAALRAITGAQLPSLCVLPPLVWQQDPAGPPVEPSRLACIGPFRDAGSLALLADACRRASVLGSQLRIEVSGDDVDDWTNLVAIEHLQRRASTLGVADHFVFGGGSAPADVAALLGRVGTVIGVGAGDRPGLPRGVVEAMAAGRAILGFSGQLDGLVQNGAQALLVPAGDALALGAAMHTLVADDALRQRLGAAARDCYEENLVPALAAKSYTARVLEVLRAGPRLPVGNGAGD